MGLSRLDGWPARSPADASPLASRPDTHGSGPTWIATPSYRTLTDYSWPVSRRTTKSLRGDSVGSGGFEAGLIQGGERGRFAMPVPLRTDFDAHALRAIARTTKDGPQARRLLALAAIYEGATRTAAARLGGVTVQIVRDWVVKFNAHGPEGLINRKPPGQPSKLTDTHRAALQAIVEQGPIPAIHGVVRWRLIDLIQWVWEEFRITISKQTLSRELRAMN